MTILDPTSIIGKVRLRIGDYSDLPILPDAVITSAYTDCDSNLPRTAALCAQYILGTLTAKTHRKLANIETWSGERFTNYVAFIKLTILNPNLMSVSPVPYTGTSSNVGYVDSIVSFQEDWNAAYGLPHKINHIAANNAKAVSNGAYGYGYTYV